jgi:transposase
MSESSPVHFGVGIDTARYGHYASFLREDRQPAAKGFVFLESAAGYERFQAALAHLADAHEGNVQFHIRLDAAGQYAVNLEAFLRRLPYRVTLSIGEPKRNKDYKNAHFPKRKADAVESLACARFAIVERPSASRETAAEFRQLRDLAGALESQRTQTTRRINQLHNHLARVFPELATFVADISANWVLTLLADYPSPQRIAAARLSSLVKIPHLSQKQAEQIQAAAKCTTGSLKGDFSEQLISHLVAEVRQSQRAETKLFDLLEAAYEALPKGTHRQLETIPGIGKRNAAALVAKIVCIDRFPSADALVSYFGAFPEENSSGVSRRGKPVPPGTMEMSAKGNDLVRGLLWMACQSAIQHNPVIRALYARQRAAGKRGDVALGHCMRKMLHLVYAVWKTDRPFDPDYERLRRSARQVPAPAVAPSAEGPSPAAQTDAAGHKGQSPDRKVVTAAANSMATRILPKESASDSENSDGSHTHEAVVRRLPGLECHVDFAELRRQVSMAQVLREAGVLDQMRGGGAQRRGPCPIHDPQRTGRRGTLSVNLDKQVFRCLHPQCAAQGNVLDFWAAFKRLPLREAALNLAETLNLKNGVITPDAP